MQFIASLFYSFTTDSSKLSEAIKFTISVTDRCKICKKKYIHGNNLTNNLRTMTKNIKILIFLTNNTRIVYLQCQHLN